MYETSSNIPLLINTTPKSIKSDSSTESWTPECIEVLHHMATKSSSLRWLHNESAHHYRHLNHRFMYISIALSSIASAGSFSTAGTQSVGMYASYVIGTFNIILAMITAIQRFILAAEKAQSHGQISIEYAGLVRRIQLELILKRMASNDVLTEISNEYSKLSQNAPYIPNKIIKLYSEKFPTVEVKPEVVEGFFIQNKNTVIETPWTRIVDLVHRSGSLRNFTISKGSTSV